MRNHRARHVVLLALLSAALLPAGCGDEPTALRLKLVVDPQLNSEAQLLSVVQTIQLVLDAPDGFAGVTDREGELVAEDMDKDGKMELVLTKPVAGLKSFPLYRFLPGSNLDHPFYITAKGIVGNEVAAVGGSALAQFSAGQNLELTVPLNLRPAYRAPRVVMSLPHDGQQAVPQALSNLYLEFSKWIAQSSIANHLHLIWRSPKGEEREVPGTWKLTNIAVNELGFPEERTAATFQRKEDCFLMSGDFRIEAQPGIADISGNSLDQDALQPGANGFKSSFRVIGTIAPADTTKISACVPPPPQGCLDNAACNPGGGTSFVCQKPEPMQPGICVPSGETCGLCQKDYVCAPVASMQASGGPDPLPGIQPGVAPTAACVPDCRVFFGCPPFTRCDFGTGLCKPCLQMASSSSDPAAPSPQPACYLPCTNTPGGCGPNTYCDPNKQICVPCPAGTACF